MSEPVMPWAAQKDFYASEERHMAGFKALLERWPAYRAHLAFGLLGGAVAVCDSLGLDVEGFVAELRKREPKPAVLVPPKRMTS